MKFRYRNSLAGFVPRAVLVIALVTSCTVEANWLPEGRAEIVGTRVDDLFDSIVMITYRLENTGDSRVISSSTVSFRIETDVREYYETVCDSSRIYMQHQVYGILEFEMPDPEEEFIQATILDSFFE